MIGKEIGIPTDAKEFDVRQQLSNGKKSFNCVGGPVPLPCYCGPRPPRRMDVSKEA